MRIRLLYPLSTKSDLCPVFFGHLTPAVEDLRYQHLYHPVPLEQKCPPLARVVNEIASGRFGDGGVYEPLLNTVRNNDYYLLTEDFDSCACPLSLRASERAAADRATDIAALALVDEAYQDRVEWIKKSISTTAKMGKFSSDRAILDYAQECWVRAAVCPSCGFRLTWFAAEHRGGQARVNSR